MDLGSMIIGVFFMAVCVVPFMLMSSNRKKKAQALLQSLSDIASQQSCAISQHEWCGDFVIGIDETKNFIFFYKEGKDAAVKQYINLAEVQKCEVVSTGRTYARKEGDQKVIDRLDLRFTPIDKHKAAIELAFFDAEVRIQLNGEVQVIEKWSKLINDRLRNKK